MKQKLKLELVMVALDPRTFVAQSMFLKADQTEETEELVAP
jgi:hypothetical protein